MKRRIESHPAATRRPSAPDKNRPAARVREEDSRSPRMRKTSAGEVPADRGANEQESLTQGSE